MKSFCSTTNKAIGYYVYLLVDPRDNTIFYVGKGKANRVFAHEKDVQKKEVLLQEKEKRIKEILDAGKEVLKYIVRLNLTQDEAYIVESVLINLLGISEAGDVNTSISLTNIQGGHGMRRNGMMLVDEVEKIFGAKPLYLRNVKHNLLCININRLYNSNVDLYNATRKSWIVNKNKANSCDYVVSEYQGIIKALFIVDKNGWYHGSDTGKGRMEFNGEEVKDEEILKLYLNKRIIKGNKGKRPSRNPIRYIIKNK